MATVYRRGKFFTAQWYRASGERIAKSTGIAAKREAKRRADEMEVGDRKEQAQRSDVYLPILRRATDQARAGKLDANGAEAFILEIRRAEDDNYRTVTLRQHLEQWKEARSKRVSDSTLENMALMIDHFAAVLPAKVMDGQIPELTKAHVEAAIHKIKDGPRKRAASTVNGDLLLLRQALKDAVENGLCTTNAAKNVQPLPEEDSTERAPFTPAEVAMLLRSEYTPDEWRGIILFGIYTGLRLGDIVRLDANSIHDGQLIVLPEKTKRKGKQNTLRIPLASPVEQWLTNKKGQLFPERRTTASAVLSNQFKRLMAKVKVDHVVMLPGGTKASRSFHSLRHSFTTWLAEANIHPDVRQKLTGHASNKAHAIYSHHEKALKDAIGKLPTL